jgi:hypothetical protein
VRICKGRAMGMEEGKENIRKGNMGRWEGGGNMGKEYLEMGEENMGKGNMRVRTWGWGI